MAEPNPIDAILARLKASTAPTVNPSVAPQVLDTATRAEVANAPAPTAPAPAPKADTGADVATVTVATATPSVAAASAAPASAAEPKTRRTAAVVQQELDAALIRIAELEATGTCSGDVLQQTTEQLVAVLRGRGYRVALAAE